jgi:hypothetical protein
MIEATDQEKAQAIEAVRAATPEDRDLWEALKELAPIVANPNGIGFWEKVLEEVELEDEYKAQLARIVGRRRG